MEEAGSVDSIESQGSWVGTAFKRCTTDRPATRERLSALSRGDTPYDPPLFDSQDQKDRLTQQAKFDRGRALEMAYTQKLAFAGREARGLGFDVRATRARRAQAVAGGVARSIVGDAAFVGRAGAGAGSGSGCRSDKILPLGLAYPLLDGRAGLRLDPLFLHTLPRWLENPF